MRVEKRIRGISTRLAIHYLEGLGGRPIDAGGRPVDGAGDTREAAARVDRVVADDWGVTLGTASVSIGPTLEVTELVLTFEGEDGVLEEVLAAFTRKARRAGG